MEEVFKIKKLFKSLMEAPVHEFPSSGPVRVTNENGVYIIIGLKDEVLHVGKTSRAKNGLDQRLQNHIEGNSSFTIIHLSGKGKKLRNGFKFKFIVVSDDRQRALLEAMGVALLCPVHLGTGGASMSKLSEK